MGSRIKIVQVIFLFLGILTIALGFFVITPQIVQSVIYHSSPGKVLTELGITLVHEFRIKIIFLGAMLFLLSIILGYSLPLTNSIIRKIESEHLVEKSVSSTGRLLDLIYRVGTNETFLWCFLILIFISLLLPNVFLSSSGGFHHESIDVQPAKNLARHGAYATLTTRGFDDYTYKITTGPGILVPIALVFKLFGINVYYSRAVYLAFSIATLIIFYHMTRDLYGKKVALLAVFISIPMILSIDEAVTEYISGLFYFLVGALFWFKSIESKKNIPLVLSGLFWGLSFQTKWLFLFAIFAVIVTCIILSLSKKGLESRYYLIPSSMVCLVTMAWFIFRIFNVGLRLELWHLLAFWGEHGHRAVGTGTEKGIFSSIYAIARPLASLSQINLWGNLQLLLTIAAIFYVIILIGKSKMTDYKSLFFMSFTIIWFIWWLLFNYDLPGLHLRIILVMSQLFIAKFLYDIWEYSSAYKDGLVNLLKNKETQKATMFYLLRIAIIYIVFGNVLLPLFKDAKFLYNFNLRVTKAEKEMMTYIRNNTEKNAVFSGWAWSMPWYVDLDSAGDHINKDRSTYPPEQRESVPEYFIVSPEWPVVSVSDEWPNVVVVNNWSIKENEIRKKFLEENCTLVKTFGGDEYKWLLYKVNNDKLSLSPRN